MPLLECRGVNKDYGGTLVFEGVSFTVEPGRKLALIGPNGAGKTTLLRIIMGEDDDFSGKLIRAPEARLGYVPQRFEPDGEATALDSLLGGVRATRAALAELEARMAGAGETELSGLLERYGSLRDAYEAEDGDGAEESAGRLLERSGLSGAADRPARALSGGEANTLGLLKALMRKPNLLLLDEPGNHLDLWGQAWLEDFLKGLPSALILVSHNRWLIDRVADGVLSMEGRTLAAYTGGYSAHRLEKLKRAAAAGAGWQADRKKIERLEALVRRFEEIAASRPDPAWGKRLRARRSQLEREKEQARQRPSQEAGAMSLSFRENDARSTYALAVKGYSKAFGERVLFEDGSFDVLRGEKIALIGRNGCGKTAFIRDLVSKGNWDDGALRVSPSMRIGYISQAQDVFRADRPVRAEFEALGAKPDEIMKLLARFLFSREDGERLPGEMSGGELNRLQLARAVFLKANFLILDEPTNHLDIPSREAVEQALGEFDGTVLLVSHDRFLLEAVADRVIFVEDRRFNSYEGNFSEYWRDAGRPRLSGISAGGGIGGRSKALERDGTAEARAEGLKGELAARIEELEKDKSELEKEASRAIDSRDFAAGRRLAGDIERLARRIDALYARWCG